MEHFCDTFGGPSFVRF